jgi:hypothetical protein
MNARAESDDARPEVRGAAMACTHPAGCTRPCSPRSALGRCEYHRAMAVALGRALGFHLLAQLEVH